MGFLGVHLHVPLFAVYYAQGGVQEFKSHCFWKGMFCAPHHSHRAGGAVSFHCAPRARGAHSPWLEELCDPANYCGGGAWHCSPPPIVYAPSGEVCDDLWLLWEFIL